jgi:hypothetical protein
MNDPTIDRKAREEAAWREHRLSQLRRFQALSLRARLEAVEGMADVFRRFREMRERGQFTSGQSDVTDWKPR